MKHFLKKTQVRHLNVILPLEKYSRLKVRALYYGLTWEEFFDLSYESIDALFSKDIFTDGKWDKDWLMSIFNLRKKWVDIFMNNRHKKGLMTPTEELEAKKVHTDNVKSSS